MCVGSGVELHKKTPELQTIEDGILILSPILQKIDLSTLLERRFTLRAYPEVVVTEIISRKKSANQRS
jgi:hypothetical protein